MGLKFPSKNAISQARDDMGWTQLQSGLRGYIQPKLSGCSGTVWVLWWHCSGMGGEGDVLAASSSCWTFWSSMHPTAWEQAWWDFRGCSCQVCQNQKIVLRGALEPAVLPFGLRTSAGTQSVLGLQERVPVPRTYLEQGSAQH